MQQDATLYRLFYLETALHVSGGTTTHHQERKQLCLQHLVFVTPLLLSWKCWNWFECAYVTHSTIKPHDDGLWYHPKHVEQFPDKINCATLHLVGYIYIYIYIRIEHTSLFCEQAGQNKYFYVSIFLSPT
jgi:hypothetical protein